MKIQDINKAKQLLQTGEVVAVPTETVYGLAGLISNPKAIEKIFITKERPFFDPLIVHVHSVEQAKKLCTQWTDTHDLLAHKFWPGPLTLICKKNKEQVSDMITAGLDTVGLRCPSHPVALKLLKSLHSPFAAPSANKFSKTSPTNADHVLASFDKKVTVLEGDYCDVGLESTIVEIDEENSEVLILRPGMVSQTQLEKVLPENYNVIFAQKSQVPGSMKRHYAPEAPFYFIQESDLGNLDKLIKPEHVDLRRVEFELSDKSQIAARELYSKLRNLPHFESEQVVFYFVMKDFHKEIPWIPIIDRLKRAADL